MDWQTFAQLWGPAVPMFAVFVFYLHRLIFVTVPGGFRRQRNAILELDRKAAERHEQAMQAFGRVEEVMIALLHAAKSTEKKTPAKQRG